MFAPTTATATTICRRSVSRSSSNSRSVLVDWWQWFVGFWVFFHAVHPSVGRRLIFVSGCVQCHGDHPFPLPPLILVQTEERRVVQGRPRYDVSRHTIGPHGRGRVPGGRGGRRRHIVVVVVVHAAAAVGDPYLRFHNLHQRQCRGRRCVLSTIIIIIIVIIIVAWR